MNKINYNKGGIIIKKIFLLCFIIFDLITKTVTVNASDTPDSTKARIGNIFFDTLEEAIAASTSTDIITLTGNVSLSDTLNINKTVNINLNNHNIEATEKVFLIEGGSLKLSGTGKIIETKPNYGAIMLKGSNDAKKTNYSTITVGSDITLEGWSGIFINHNNKTAYGVLVNMNGTINAIDDINGSPGTGIYVNGNIQHQDNSPIINLTNTTKITSTGNGIYAAGFAIYNINGASISGEQSGLGIKSGIFNIKDGTILGTGPDKTPTSGNNNGINSSGSAIQIESNAGYKGDIELYIKNGKIESKNSNVIYEYTVNNTSTKVKNIELTGGSYTSNANKDVFLLSDSFKNTHPKFISGGIYSSNPSQYLENGYNTSLENSKYRVIANTMQVFAQSVINNNYPSVTLIIILTIIISIILILNRKKILNLIKKK